MQARYRLYGEWEKDDECIPMVLAARQIAKVLSFPSSVFEKHFIIWSWLILVCSLTQLDTGRILKRLAKENS